MKLFQSYRFSAALMAGLLTVGSFAIVPSSSAREVIADFSDVAQEAIPAVVSIKIKMAQQPTPFSQRLFGQREEDNSQRPDLFQHFFGMPRDSAPIISQGSGFIVSPDGYILSNTHVVNDALEINVTLNDGREFVAKLVGTDPNTDVAVIKIDGKDLPHLKFANSDALKVGQWVIAIGNPLGLQATLTVGVVSAKGRNNLDLTKVEDFIQTDASINHGNSGGPLLNADGEVVGMNTAIVTSLGGGGLGIGLAIPSNIAKLIMNELITDGTVSRGYLGVTLQPVDNDLAKAFGLDRAEGALVADVQKGSPAAQIGIKQGDIIIKFNNSPVSSGAALRTSVSLIKPGTKTSVVILRDGKSQDLVVELGDFPQEKVVNNYVAPQINHLGFSIDNLTPEITKQLNLQDGQGVLITQVDPNGIAALAGLKQGAVILSVNKKVVSTTAQFDEELKNTPQDKPILFLIRQGEQVRFVSVKLG